MTHQSRAARLRGPVVVLLVLALVVPPGPVFEGSSLPRFDVPVLLRLPRVDLAVPNPLGVLAAAWNGLADAATGLWNAVASTPGASADDPPSFDAGAVTTLAGDGTKADVDGSLPAQLSGANGIAASGSKVWVSTDYAIRTIDRSAGTVATLAGSATKACTNNADPTLVRFNGDEKLTTDGTDVFSASQGCGWLRRTQPNGATTTLAVASWRDVTYAPDGNLYATASGIENHRLYRVNKTTGALTTLVNLSSSSQPPTAVAADASAVYFVHDNAIKRYALPSGPLTTLRANDTLIGTNALESVGGYLIGDGGTSRTAVRRYDKATGNAHVLAGSFTAMFVDATGADAGFGVVRDIAFDGASLFVADDTNNRVRQVADAEPFAISGPAIPPATDAGVVTTVTTTTALTAVRGIAAVGSDLWISGEQQLRRVNPATGVVTNVAGTGGSAGCVDGIGSVVRFNGDEELATDGYAVYSASGTCGRVRRTGPNGATSTLLTIGGTKGIAYGPDGYLYVSAFTTSGGFLHRVHPTDGGSTQIAALGSQNVPDGVAVDGTAAYVSVLLGNGTRTIIRVDLATLAQTTFASDQEIGLGTLESAGPFLYGAGGPSGSNLRRYDKSNGVQTTVAGSVARWLADGTAADAGFYDVRDITSDGTAIYVADDVNNRIRKIVPGTAFELSGPQAALPIANAYVSTVPTQTALGVTSGVAVDGDDLWVMSGPRLSRVAMSTGAVTTVAGTATAGCVDGDAASVRFAGDEELVTDGYAVYSASYTCAKVRRTSPDGRTVTLFALSDPYGIDLGPDGYLYVAGRYSNHGSLWRAHPTNGGAAQFAMLDAFDLPQAVAVDAEAAYVNSIGANGNQRILRRVDLATRALTTVRMDYPADHVYQGMTLQDGGAYLYADGLASNSIVRIDKTTTEVTRLTGVDDAPGYTDGLGVGARFDAIADFTSDGVYLYVADHDNHAIRAVLDDHFLFPGAEALGDDPYTGWREDVNPALGSFELVAEDLRVGTPGPALGITRTYNSLDLRHSPFGVGWTFDYDMQWRPGTGGDVVVLHPDGRRETHTLQPGGTFTAPPGYFSTLATAGSGYTLTTRERTVYAFGASGRLDSVTDANGRTVSLTYSPSGRLTNVTDESGRGLELGWTGGHVTSVRTDHVAAHGGRLEWRYYYDGPRLVRACDPIDNVATGRCTVYGYTAAGLLNRVTKPGGNVVTTLTYDANGKVLTRGDGHGHDTTFTVVSPTVVDVTDPRDNVTRQTYDAQYRLVSELDPDDRLTTYEYDARGVRYRVTNPAGESVVTNTDARGNAVSVTNAEGETRYTEFDALDRVVAERDARSTGATDDTYAVEYTYDTAGNRLTESAPPTDEYPAGRQKSWTYSTGTEAAIGGGTVPRGLTWSATDFRGNVTTFRYDAYGDLREVTDPEGLRTEYVYDELGRRTATTMYSDSFPLGVTTTVTYDALGHVLTETEPAVLNEVTNVTHRKRTTNSFDENGNVLTVTESDLTGGDMPRVTTMTYDDLDRMTSVTDAEDAVTSRTYDEAGNVATITDGLGRVRRATYDARNLMTRVDLLDYENPAAPATPRDIPLMRATYDDAGRIETQTDPLGRVRRTTYDDAGRATALTLEDYVDRDTTVRDVVLEATGYDAAGRVVSRTTGNGRLTVTTAYDEAGWTVSSTVDPADAQHPDALDRVTTWTHDRDGNVLSETRTGGGRTEQTRTTYDAMSRPLTRTVENGATDLTTAYAYDDRGLPVAITDPRGNTTNTRYDELGRAMESKAPSVSVETSSGVTASRPTRLAGYDTFGDATHQRDARGAVTVTAFDRTGRTVGVTYPSYVRPDATTLTPTESYTYDDAGNVVSFTGRDTRVTDTVYDDLDRPVKTLDPLVTGAAARGTVVTTYDDAGNVTRVVDQRGDRTDRSYDALDRVRTETVWSTATTSHVTTLDYDDAGNRTYVKGPDAARPPATSTYSAANELLTSTDEVGKITRYTYDLASRRTETRDPLGRKSREEYDLAGRLTTLRRVSPADVVLTTESRGYDGAGNVTSTTTARGFTMTYAYDAANRLSSVVRPVDATRSITTSYGYDAEGALTRVTNGRGAVTRYTYNAWGLAESTIEPSTAAHPSLAERTFTTTYDAAGRAVLDAQPGGVTVARTFDELGRLTSETGSGSGVTTATRTFGYDLTGLTTSLGHPSGTVALSYDGRKLLTGASGPAGSATFVRDGVGRITSRTDAAGTSTFTWTNRDELASVTDGVTNSVRVHTWDDASQLKNISYRLAAAPTVETSKREFAHDDLGRVVHDKLSANGVTQAFHETNYDEDDNVTWQRVTYGTMPLGTQVVTSYTYDRSDRIASSYRAPTLTTYGWDDADNRTSAGTQSFTYDDRNRLLTGPAGTYAYSARGTLASITAPGLGGATTTYAFDGLGRMRGLNGAATYSYDSLDRVAVRAGAAFSYAGVELDPVSDGTSTYGRSPGGSLLSVATGLASSLVANNRHGDVEYTFSPTGVVGGGRVYGPFGDVVASTGTVAGSLGFQGGYTDPATGDVAMNTRWYRPGTGGFLSRDSVLGSTRDPESLNRYLYANANPLRFYDPDGRAAIEANGAVSMPEYHAAVAKQNRLEAEARVLGVPLQLNGRDRPWIGADSLGRALARARLDHHCGCDFHKQAYLEQEPWWVTSLKATHQVFGGIGNTIVSTATLGHVSEIVHTRYDKESHMGLAYASGQFLGLLSTVPLGAGAFRAASEFSVVARATTAIRSASLGTQVAVGAAYGGTTSALSKGATLKRVLLGAVVGGAVPLAVRGLQSILRPVTTSADEVVESTYHAQEAAERDLARGPVGRRGSPMDVPRGTNTPATINGRSFGGHALDEMMSEGFTPSVVEDAIRFGQATTGQSGRVVYYSSTNNVSVIMEHDRVVTVTSGRVKVR